QINFRLRGCRIFSLRFVGAEEKAGNPYSDLGHRIEKPHADLDRNNEIQANLFRMPCDDGFRPQLAKEQKDDGEDDRLTGQGEINVIRADPTSYEGGGNGGGADIRKIAP